MKILFKIQQKKKC